MTYEIEKKAVKLVDLTLTNWLENHATTNKVLVAFSGGLDSTVLLHALSKQAVKVRAVHINHGLSPNALAWEQHCEMLCIDLGLQLVVKRVKLVKERGQSLEALARTARYAAFAEVLIPGEGLVTAHHMDDQVETFFLNLLRGSSVAGLAGMPKLRYFGANDECLLLRPFLSVPRKILEAYALHYHLTWVEDESNRNLNFVRNKLRHKVIPFLEQEFPEIKKSVFKTAGFCAESLELQRLMAKEDGAFSNIIFPLEDFLSLRETRQVNALRYWMYSCTGGIFPPELQLIEFIRQIVTAKNDTKPSLVFAGYRFMRDMGNICAVKIEDKPILATKITMADISNLEKLKNGASITLFLSNCAIKVTKTLGSGVQISQEEMHSLLVKKRSGGETCITAIGHKKLKKLLQEKKIALVLRDKLPLIYLGDELIYVPLIWQSCKRVVKDPNQHGFNFEIID